MPSSSDFFSHRNPQAVLKHGLLTRYAYYFAGRAGAATQGRVAFIDGYAGEGRYQDGSLGSPLLLASQATRAQIFKRDVKLALVEKDDNRRARLEQSLQESGLTADQLIGDDLSDVIDGLLDRYSRHAVLIFLDPFGLVFDRTTLERVLRRSSRHQPIDVLYHFSLSTVARMGRASVGRTALAPQNAYLLESALGPIRWRAEFKTATEPNAATEAALTLAGRFGESVTNATKCKSTGVPVRNRPGQLPKYLLMLFSTDERAHWDFADQASKAYVDWLYYCTHEEYKANVQHREGQGLLELFPSPEPEQSEIDGQLKAEAADYLPGHLRDVLYQRGPLRLVDAVEDIYGEMLGRARATHVRTAIKTLHDRGLVDDNGKGDFWLRQITWTGS